MVDPKQVEAAAKQLKRRELSKDELLKYLDDHVRDRAYRGATQAAYISTTEQAGVIRRGFSERLDAYKWVAALSSAAFFFLGQSIAGKDAIFTRGSATAAAVAQSGFFLSLLGAAMYMFIVDRKASAWHEIVFTRSGRVMTLLAGMDAGVDEARIALERDDVKAANDAFWETIDIKLTMGRETSKPVPTIPEDGRLGGMFAALRVGGLVLGLAAASVYQWLSYVARVTGDYVR